MRAGLLPYLFTKTLVLCWHSPATNRLATTTRFPPKTPTHRSATSVSFATGKGHLAAEHATVADNYDAWKMSSGDDRRRRLGLKVNSDSMSNLGQMLAQDAVKDAAGGSGSVRFATKVGREAGVIDAVGTHLDTRFHLGAGEVPEGPVTRGDVKGWDGRPTQGVYDNND